MIYLCHRPTGFSSISQKCHGPCTHSLMWNVLCFPSCWADTYCSFRSRQHSTFSWEHKRKLPLASKNHHSIHFHSIYEKSKRISHKFSSPVGSLPSLNVTIKCKKEKRSWFSIIGNGFSKIVLFSNIVPFVTPFSPILPFCKNYTWHKELNIIIMCI